MSPTRLLSRAILATCLLGAGIATSAHAADGPIGAVQKVKPDAFGTPPSGERATLSANDEVVADENIETGPTGSLHVKFIDETDLWLDENSALVLDEMVFERDASTGKFIAEFGPGLFRFATGALPHESYEVRTPVAVIGVRGTDFSVAVARNGATRVTSYDQAITVRARASGPSVTSPPASTASVGKENGPVNVDPFAVPVAPPTDSVSDRAVPAIDVPTIGGVGGGGKVGHSPPSSSF
ncbi:MAG: hypothetical protein FJX66_12315 [Alphaproteobacteria bacterium]|nr:hypothetical protein [Alphaproteobacteria bacterium]